MRLHQSEMDTLAGKVAAGTFTRKSITLDCTPGGGKTGSATLFSNRLLDAGVVDGILWVVPRLSLAEQVSDAFANGFGSRAGRFLEVVDGQDSLFAPSLPNMPHPSGYVTTYQTISHRNNWKRFREAISPRRVLIIFDEVQFLNDELEGGWYPKVMAVQGAAAFSLLMSGTLWRTDNGTIPFVSYERREDGKLYPLSDVSYSLRDAVADMAVLPTEWRNRSGVVEYTTNGIVHMHDLLDKDDDEESRKVRSFLSSEKAVGKLIDDMVCDWREWVGGGSGYNSRMIVIAQDIKEARRWRDYMEKKHAVSCVLATTKEEAAGRKLKHFRERRHGQCLVTVAMAYVGFDCPDLTHMAYLSPTRAPSWMLQSAARVSRFDSKAPIGYDQQHAFVYAPDDERIRLFFTWLRNETEIGIQRRAGKPGGRPGSGGNLPPIPIDDFEPIDADPGSQAIELLTQRLDPATVARLDDFARLCPVAGKMSKSALYEVLLRANPGWFQEHKEAVS